MGAARAGFARPRARSAPGGPRPRSAVAARRQWQFREFAANDGGSPIVTQLSASVAALTKWCPQPSAVAGRLRNYSVSAVPLETLVEADDIRAAPTARMRVRSGQHFERMLTARGLGLHVAAFRTAYSIAPAADAPDAAARHFLAV